MTRKRNKTKGCMNLKKLKAEEALSNDLTEIIEVADDTSLIEIAELIIKGCNNPKCSACISIRKKIDKLKTFL